MALYETTIILRPELATTEVEKVAEGFSTVISENKGKVIKKEIWGLKELAFKVKKNKKGYYVHYNLEGNGDTVAELRRKLKLSEDVIRDLTIQVKAFNDNAKDFGEE